MKKRNRPLSNQLHPRRQRWSKISSSESPVHKLVFVLVFVSLCFRWPSLVGSFLLKMALETVRRSTFFTSKLLLTAAAAFSVAPKLLRAEFCSDGKCSDEVEKAKLASDAAEKYRPEDSIFSKIIRKEIPADIIHEDEKVSSVLFCVFSPHSSFSRYFLETATFLSFLVPSWYWRRGGDTMCSIGKCCGCLWRREKVFLLLYSTTNTFVAFELDLIKKQQQKQQNNRYFRYYLIFVSNYFSVFFLLQLVI